MARLIIFVCFIAALAFTMSLSRFKKLTPNNATISLSSLQKTHDEHLKAVEEANKVEEEVAAVAEPEESKRVELVLDTPMLQAGHDVYHKTGKCVTCHGKHGQGKKSQKAPRLAAQFDWYLEEQLNLMKSGTRVNEKMVPYLKKLNAEDFKNVAHYLSKLSAE